MTKLIHHGLDLFGFIPIVGDIVDVGHAIWYFSEGRNEEGWISLGSAFPVAGDIILKGGGKGGKALFKSAKALRVAKIATRVAIQTAVFTTANMYNSEEDYSFGEALGRGARNALLGGNRGTQYSFYCL